MIYDFKVKTITGENMSLEKYKDKIILIVNTATECGLASQLEDLEVLYQKYKHEGLVVLGFPSNQFANQEKGTNKEVLNTCKINFGVTFQLFSKIEVNGPNTEPLYKYLKSNTKTMYGKDIKWNFTKFLIDRKGNILKRFSPTTKITTIENYIIKNNLI